MARAGRKKKINVVRDSSGKSRGEIVDFSTVFNQPHRRGQADPMSQLHGTALGRLRALGVISIHQVLAGEEWIRLVSAYRRALEAPSTSPRCADMAERVSNGFYVFESEHHALDEEEARRQRMAMASRYNLCFESLAQIDRTMNVNASRLIRMVCIEDRDPAEYQIGDIRVGLNCLAKHLLGEKR